MIYDLKDIKDYATGDLEGVEGNKVWLNDLSLLEMLRRISLYGNLKRCKIGNMCTKWLY
jgi:hypothetical protein